MNADRFFDVDFVVPVLIVVLVLILGAIGIAGMALEVQRSPVFIRARICDACLQKEAQFAPCAGVCVVTEDQPSGADEDATEATP